MARTRRIAHFVFGLRPQTEPFHVLHYAAVESCRQVVDPDEIHFHCEFVPYGVYWDRLRPYLHLHHVERLATVIRAASEIIAPWEYAHHADVIRLDVLLEHGGLYCDIDVIWVQPPPASAWEASFLIGREAPVGDPRTGLVRPSLCNAVMFGSPGSAFARRWRDQIEAAMDGTWSAHSCFLAHDLATAHPAEVTVVDRMRFAPVDYSVDGYRALLEDGVTLDPATLAVHLAAHLWWDEDRIDFSRVHGNQLHAPGLRHSGSTLARLVRPFVPDGLLPDEDAS